MNSIRTIVAAVDFGKASEAALAQALRIGAWSRATVHGVHVVDTGVLLETQEAMSMLQADIQSALQAEAAQRWAAFLPGLPGRSDCRFHVVVNDARHALLGLAEQLSADLMVLGVRGDDTGGKGPGPLATACMHRARCPVLLAQEGQSGPYRTIVACVDFSETSRRALEAAARVALQDGSALRVLHVFRAPWRDNRLLMLPPVSAEGQARYREALREKIESLWAGLGEEFSYLKPRAEVVEHTSHGRGIVEYAQRENADLIVLGTRGRTNLKELLLGSTAERVIRSAGRSVLAVR
ncbi:MAG: universal stress protein [Phycisphaeraceae bacterium]|nr:universal stress protein [Phycisphaeraceae bacterium]